MTNSADKPAYTCNEYRIEMILLSLAQRLNKPGLSEAEKQALTAEIKKVKAEMGME
ncbi:MAG: hypothetical protein R6T92_07985 [Desulfosalsimonadaceae bacterium]